MESGRRIAELRRNKELQRPQQTVLQALSVDDRVQISFKSTMQIHIPGGSALSAVSELKRPARSARTVSKPIKCDVEYDRNGLSS
jgi:hypothetical protein